MDKLAGFGIDVDTRQIVTSSLAVGRYLEENFETGGKRAFVIGEGGLLEQIEERGLVPVGPEDALKAEFVFVGWDRFFDFEKLKAAVVAIRNGATYIATNTDSTYPTPDGLWPGAGSIVAAVSTGSGKDPYVAGKPNPLIVRLALDVMGASARETLLVGDRLDTDIVAGRAAGVDTLLVLTGVSGGGEAEGAETKPTHVAESLRLALS